MISSCKVPPPLPPNFCGIQNAIERKNILCSNGFTYSPHEFEVGFTLHPEVLIILFDSGFDPSVLQLPHIF